jgi:hypothetical protein
MQELLRSRAYAVGVIEECFGDVGVRTVESGLLEAPRTCAKSREADLQVRSGKEYHVPYASSTFWRDARSLRINTKYPWEKILAVCF